MALSPSRDHGSTQVQSPRSPHNGFSITSRSSPHVRPSSTAPMSVPNPNPSKKSPPPPLPPPRYLESIGEGQELAHRPFEGESTSNGSGSIKSGSSLLGGSSGSARQYTGPQKNVDFSMGSPTNEGNRDEGSSKDQRVPDLGAVVEYNKLQGEKHLGQRSNESSSARYDKQVLARIGGPSTPPRSAGAHSSSGQPQEDHASPKSFKDIGGSLRPLSVTDRRRSDATDSPRWPPSALSPSFQSLQSPLSVSDADRRAWSRPPNQSHHSNNPSESQIASPRDDNNMSVDTESAVADESHLSELNINDKRPHSSDESKTGQKRRAQSPPSTTIDPNLRQQENGGGRDAQVARLQHQDSPSLASSVASSNMQPGSYQSSYGFSAGSSATSYASQRPPSSGLQQQMSGFNGQPQTPQDASSGQSVPPTPSQPQHQMGPPPLHRRAGSSGIARPPGVFICECCPKKPKKFDNEEDLRVHEMEKQYFCQFCHNRFKNKNEAERHQNSLHLRRHSWSCAALQSLEDAFHPTMNANMTAAAATTAQSPQGGRFPNGSSTDTCGYCGQEFPNPADWNVRVEHLNHVHKFGECNQSKKFFRADHFRQHLKHSHAGTSGRWTNMLENACMREEPLPQPMSQAPMGMTAPGPIPVGQLQHIPHGMQFPSHMQPQQPQMQQPQMQQAQMQQTPQQMMQQQSQQMQNMQQPQPQMQQPQQPRMQQSQQPQMQQQAPQAPQAPQMQQPQMQEMPQQPQQPMQAPSQNAPGAPMTEQQAQEAAQQATQEANQQQQEQTEAQQPTPQPAVEEAAQPTSPPPILESQPPMNEDVKEQQ